MAYLLIIYLAGFERSSKYLSLTLSIPHKTFLRVFAL